MEQNTYKLSFAALDPYWVSNVPEPTESSTPRGFVTWGNRNDYADYLFDMYLTVPTLKSIIDTMVSYVCGNASIVGRDPQDTLNSKGQTFTEILEMCVRDYMIYGGFSLNVLRNRYNGIAEVHYVNFKNLRTNEDYSEFYFSNNWSGKSNGRVKFITYPAFNSGHPNEIFYYTSSYNSTYPYPIHYASLNSCVTEKMINEYHMNSLNNGFMSNVIINLNNGIPQDEQKLEIEENFYDKFCGTGNAGRPILSWNDDKDHAVSIEKLNVDDFADKYNTLVKRCRNEIFMSYRMNPNLMGISTENIGFSKEEYEQSFKIFQTTVISPIQRNLVKVFNKIFGDVQITPFKIDWENEE